MKAYKVYVSVCLLVGLLASTAGALSMDTVAVGNTGNIGELSGAGVAGGWGPDRICGAVDYSYRIGKYEVTAGQYTEFLNAVAKIDPYGLYNTGMWSDGNGCKIQRSGTSGSYAYSVASDYANRPVNYVSWGDAARFCNWLTGGDTEHGSYELNGATTSEQLISVTRSANARYAIPTEDEWYKAAYYDPNKSGGTGYWDYPTGSDSVSTSMANYERSVEHTTDVGSYAYSSPYGTFDQGGNVWEWNEAVFAGGARGFRGGSYRSHSADQFLLAGSRAYLGDMALAGGIDDVGFRIVEVPEPCSLVMLAFGGLALIRRKRV